MEESKETKLFESDDPIGNHILEWWESLRQNRGDRAELRRAKSLQEIQQTSAYQRCYWQLIKYFPQDRALPLREQMAVVIGLAAHIEEDDSEKKDDQGRQNQKHDYFGYQISRGDKPRLSELRFRRLLRIPDREKLFHYLVQVIRILERRVSLLDLVSIAYYWGDKAKMNLAYKYYEFAKLED